MNRLLRKNLYGLLCTVILAAVLFGISRMMAKPAVAFSLETGGESCRIEVFSGENGENYVFLPSYANMRDLTVTLSFGAQASINGVPLKNGMSCEDFELNKPYEFGFGNGAGQTVSFLKSSNVAAMYINTGSGTMEKIHEKKENTEHADVILISESGILEYSSGGCMIKGRGNVTWGHDKKPYVITLPREADLLGMGVASKWVLLANATDESNLQNKIVLDFAGEFMDGWVPGCEYVDLYLNGTYSGLYLLCEKVEAAAGRVELDPDAGDFLCRTEIGDRWEILKNPVVSKANRAVEISAPDLYTEEQKLQIKNQIDNMEEMIFSGRDLTQEPAFDEASWIDKYLIDEIFANIDSDLCSSYFYRMDGIFYAGPIWDYDMVLGNSPRNAHADAFLARNLYKTVYGGSSYYDALYRNDHFYARMVETYETEYLPALQKLVNDGIRQQSMRISDASAMNSLRWRQQYQDIVEYASVNPTSAESICSYLRDRISFLNRVWLDGEQVCTVQYLNEDRTSYISVSVKPGTVLSAQLLGLSETQWNALRERSDFDLGMPVMEDAVLDRHGDYDAAAITEKTAAVTGTQTEFSTQEYITLASIAVLGLFLGVLTVVAIRNQIMGRRSANAQAGTKISA